MLRNYVGSKMASIMALCMRMQCEVAEVLICQASVGVRLAPRANANLNRLQDKEKTIAF